MIYIHHTSGYNAVPSREINDIKMELKKVTGKVFRRTDRYIQLALLGAHNTLQNIELDSALLMSSGEGNLSVFNRLRDHRHMSQQPPRPIDFINLLSNTAGFYVAQYLNLNGKNLFLSHHGFPTQMALILAENDLRLEKQKQFLLGGVDELLEPVSYTKKFLGICNDTALGEGSNWLTVNMQKDGALASIETMVEELNHKEVLDFISRLDNKYRIAFGMRTNPEEIVAFMESTQCSRFDYESTCGYYETVPFYSMRLFIEQEQGQLVFIDCFEKRYRVNTLRVFG